MQIYSSDLDYIILSTFVRISCPMMTNFYKVIRRNVNGKHSIRFPNKAKSYCSVFEVKTPFSNWKCKPGLHTVNLTEIVTGKIINIKPDYIKLKILCVSTLNSCHLLFLLLFAFFVVFCVFCRRSVLSVVSVFTSSIIGLTSPFTGFVITKFSSVTWPQSISWVAISSESPQISSSFSSEDSSLLSLWVSTNARFYAMKMIQLKIRIKYTFKCWSRLT